MRNRILIVLAVMLLLGLGASASLADSSARPFKGRVSRSISQDIGEWCFLVEGTIIATHMGEGTYTSGGCLDPDSLEPPQPGILCADLDEGTTWVEFVAANGDELYGSLEGFCCVDLVTGDTWGTFHGPFTGGTGRFAGAQGEVVKEWTGYETPSGSFVDSSWEGWIAY